MKGKKEFNDLLDNHIRISRMVSKHFLKIGKKESSTITSHEVIIIDGESRLKTVIKLFPKRRMYTHGSEKYSNPHEYYEMKEDIEL